MAYVQGRLHLCLYNDNHYFDWQCRNDFKTHGTRPMMKQNSAEMVPVDRGGL